MTPGEKKWLAVGILSGVAITCALVQVLYRTPAAERVGATGQGDSRADATSQPAAERTAPIGIQLTRDEQTRIGLQTIEVVRRTVSEEIVAPGSVEELEGGVRTITAPWSGRVDRLLLDFVGRPVEKGQPVALISSPEIVTAVKNYKSALEGRRQLPDTAQGDLLSRADAVAESARRQLEALGLSSAQIQKNLTTPEDEIRAEVHSEWEGVLRSKNVTEGRFVNKGEVLFALSDLSTVWVRASVFESEIGRVRPGLTVHVTTDALPGVTLRGSTSFAELRSDPQMRTTPVRIEVPNPGMRLKPGMFVRCAFQVPMGKNVLTVPRAAVIDTGMAKIVYVAQAAAGGFQRRSIKVGALTRDGYPVLEGLAEGDKVVINGAFLMESQTRLTGGMTGLFTGSKSFGESSTGAGDAEGAYSIAFEITPDPPKASENMVRVSVLDSVRQPVRDAQVRITLVMPAMPSMGMPEMRRTADLQLSGSHYLAPIHLGMSGSWNVVVEARRGNQILVVYQTRLDAR